MQILRQAQELNAQIAELFEKISQILVKQIKQ